MKDDKSNTYMNHNGLPLMIVLPYLTGDSDLL